MCTVTVLPRACLSARRTGADALLLRVACNRDERLVRPLALPPALHVVRDRRIVMPTDPESGGTWMAANDAGVIFALLNANESGIAGNGAGAGGESRGGVIPGIVGASTVTEAVARLVDSDPRRFRAFRLMVLDRYQLAECWLEEGRPRYRRAYLQSPLMRTSSSLGDALVDPPRRTLFRQFFRAPSDGLAAQDAFHDHQWPGREAVSVRMQRADARTVSRTVIELGEDVITFSYQATGDTDEVRLLLPLAPLAANGRVAQCS